MTGTPDCSVNRPCGGETEPADPEFTQLRSALKISHHLRASALVPLARVFGTEQVWADAP
jgi:hypothetical protein